MSTSTAPQARWPLALALVLLAWISLALVQPPAPRPADADPAEFSAQRAMPWVRSVGQQAHFMGTAAHAHVREQLLRELRQLGLQPQVQSTFALTSSARRQHVLWAGPVNNILVRLDGRAPDHAQRRALLLAAHYDSVQHGPGGADDSASVAAILETLRALRHGAGLDNDLIVLFSDGEEVGLLGAQAFVAEHPWAKDVGLALNFEYRGNAGPMQMFETSAGNRALIAGLARAVAHPVANSLNYEVYKRLPNDTDLTELKQGNLAGMNFAAIDGHVVYHTPLDTPEQLSLATLQHEGDTMLGLVRHFGHVDLGRLQAEDAVYFDIAGQVLVHYAQSWSLTLCAATTLLFFGLLRLARQKSHVRVARALLAGLAFVGVLLVLAGLSHAFWQGVLQVHPSYRVMFMGSLYNGVWYLGALAAMLVGAYGWAVTRLQRWWTPFEWCLGVALAWLVALWLSALFMPGASGLLQWPLLFFLLAQSGLQILPQGNAALRSVVQWVGMAPGVLLLVPLLHAIFVALGPNAAALLALVAVGLLGLLSPLLMGARNGRTARDVLPWAAAGVVCLAAGSATSEFDAQHPQPTNVYYFQDANQSQAHWVSEDAELNAWSRLFFPADATRQDTTAMVGKDIARSVTASGQRLAWVASAQHLGLTAPGVRVLSDQVTGSRRTLNAEVWSARSAEQLWVALEGAQVHRAEVNGRPASAGPGAVWELKTTGLRDAPLRLVWEVDAQTPFTLRLKDRSFGWPGFESPAQRAPEFIAKANLSSDSVFVQRIVSFSK